MRLRFRVRAADPAARAWKDPQKPDMGFTGDPHSRRAKNALAAKAGFDGAAVEELEAVQKLFIDFSTKFSVEPASSRLDQSKAGWKLAPQS